MEIYYKDLRPGYNVIDIRDRYEYDQGHYINSINIPYMYLLNNPDNYLNKRTKYYIYCTSGVRSKRASEILNMLGYTIVNVKDGYKDKLF